MARHTLTPAMRRAVAANRKRILSREAQIAAMIAAAYQTAQRSIQPTQQALINAYADELDALQAASGDDEEDDSAPTPTVPTSWATSSGQLPRLNRTVLLALGAFALSARMHITDGQRQAALAGASDAQSLVKTALQPLVVRFGLPFVDSLARRPPGNVLDALVGKSLTTGNPLSTLLDRLGEPTATKVTQALYAALSSGAHPTVAARAITQATGMAYNRALTISRTEMLGAYRSASINTYRASSDVVDGWVWVAAAGCCDFCAEMNGTLHDLSEDMDSHPNCRCAASPHTKPLSDILSMFAA